MKRLFQLAALFVATVATLTASAAEKLCDHDVVLDKDGRLLPWTSFDTVLKQSINYMKRCPTVATQFDNAPCWRTGKWSLSSQARSHFEMDL